MPANRLIIFDFDGVLVDTEHATFQYYREVLPQYGFRLTEDDFRHKIGRKSIDFFRSVMGDKFDPVLVEKLTQQKRQDFTKNISQYVTPIPGAFTLLQACYEDGLLLALGSQNEQSMLQACMQYFNLNHYFTLVRSLQDLTHRKPHPEIFLGIASELNIPPSLAVVIEDSLDGIQAAQAGGFKVVGIASSSKGLPRVDLLVETPANLTVEQLKNL